MLHRDEYFGLRVRLISSPSHAINIPVNSTVGPSGACPALLSSPAHVRYQQRWTAGERATEVHAHTEKPRAEGHPHGPVAASAGTVLITFKSPNSIPPYRIENHCDDVFVYFAQSRVARDHDKWNWLQPRVGGARMAYAWDEPIMEHQLTVQVWRSPGSCLMTHGACPSMAALELADS